MPTRDQKDQTAAPAKVDFYDSTYGRFDDSIYREVRHEVWHDDFGQNGWITAQEQDRLIEWLSLGAGQRLLDVACGSGGPTLRIAARTGARAVGIDIHPEGVRAGRQEAARRGLSGQASFEVMDAQAALPFESGTFDAITCIDAINHLADRPRVLAQWAHVLRPGGRLLFTDPAVVTGPLTSEEIAIRSSIGFFLFVAPDTNERLLTDAGFRLGAKSDLSDTLARVAADWHAARQRRAAALKDIESEETFEGQQRFLGTASRLALERRLSRVAYLAVKA